MLKRIVTKIGGDPNQKIVDAYAEIAVEINALEAEYEVLSDETLAAKTSEFKARLEQGETLDDLMVEAFAAVREASKRTLGMRHFDTQLIGGMVLHGGSVAEMRTGEGKTLMSTLAIYLNALPGKGVHLITVNDYLARRDARWMAPIYTLLGLSVGVLQMGSRTESGTKAFLVDLKRDHPQEDQHQLVMVDRSEAYAADITYGTNSEFGFDYLRDNMRMNLDDRSQRGHNYAIIDEIDNVLIDEARTPLIISGPAHDDAENYMRMAAVVKRLGPGDYEVNEKDRNVILTELGEMRVEQMLGVPLRDPDRPEDVTPEQARMMGFLEQALRATFLFKRNKDYLIQGKQVIIIDTFTGRLMPGRRWSDGLHQAVEAKENVPVQSENITHATITIQNYFRMYEKLSGMTGTALTEAEEFNDIYKLEVVAIPPLVEYNASGDDATLNVQKAKDEYGYEYTYYSQIDDPENARAYFKRKDYPDVVFRTEEAKLRSIVTEIIQYHVIGRPQLIGTTSVESSDQLSSRLRTDMIRKLMQALLLRKTWFEANDRIEDGRMVMALSFLNEPFDKLKSNEMNQLAKDLGISLNVDAPENMDRLLRYLGLEESHQERLVQVLKKGIPHSVLNARKHTEESQIIAGAGAFGAVTIATNMAGRGVDIKLGGEIAEEMISAVNRILKRVGEDDPYNMSMEERLEAIQKVSADQRGIYEAEIDLFIKSMDDMEKVKQLGGLHVIGSERHEARRIDNQLRGRAARLGDPGSSRFYLSMQDELMRLFGGQQVEGMMARLGMDDALPLEARIVSSIIEQSQTRVEGANFDSRKHLLEYDDVLNAQRQTIYNQRDRIFVKDDLTQDVREMLETEVERRIPESMEDPEGSWKLLAWLEQIQPTMVIGNIIFPSFTYKLLIDHMEGKPYSTPEGALDLLLEIAEGSLREEKEHILETAASSLALAESRMDDQLADRIDSLDLFFETLRYADETEAGNPKQMLDDLSVTISAPLNLSNQEQRLLMDDPDQVYESISEQIDRFLTLATITRMISAIERRINDDIDLDPNELAEEEWETVTEKILGAVEDNFNDRRNRLLGEDQDGQLARDVRQQLSSIKGEIDQGHLARLLLVMPQGEVTGFDKKTHRQVKRSTTRLTYFYYAAQLLGEQEPDTLVEKILKHMDNAEMALMRAWGLTVWDQVKNSPVGMLDMKVRETLADALGEEKVESLKAQKLAETEGEERRAIIEALGRRGVTETYRQLILRVISELWIEYLTKMEALRVSIGLEAYAQRDPLVQYKAQASGMFQQLFSDMRMGVVTRMFTFRPRQQQAPAQTTQAVPQPKLEADSGNGKPSAPPPAAASGNGEQSSGDGKRKRKRKRK